MGKITISTLDRMKAAGEKFVCITAYDATFARLVSEAGAETILVGDSLGMVLQGHDSTIPVTVDAMAYHTECVCRARPHSLVIADMPFMSYTNREQAMENATALMQAGAQMVKVEGGTWLSDSINGLVERLQRANADLGITLLVIEHNMRVIMNLASHIYCLAHGQLLADGNPEQVQNDPRVLDAFFEKLDAINEIKELHVDEPKDEPPHHSLNTI